MQRKAMTRRRFFESAAALGGAAALGWSGVGVASAAPPAAPSASQRATGRPLILSTWRWGKGACETAAEVLAGGGSLLDALEKGINRVELDPDVLTVGLGGKPNAEGVVQLDAAIMDGPTHRAGAVGALEKIPTAISVARRVLERTTHTLLGGAGALEFAMKEGFEPQPLLTAKSLELWEAWRRDPKRQTFWRAGEAPDTVTMVILDADGNLAAGGSTSGLEWKIPGRIGDVSLIGCGVYVDNAVGGAGATGDGDEMIKFCTSVSIVERMRQGMDPQAACESVLHWMLEKNPADKDLEACVYAVNKKGEYGAASIRPKDFTYAVWMPGVSELRVAKSIL